MNKIIAALIAATFSFGAFAQASAPAAAAPRLPSPPLLPPAAEMKKEAAPAKKTAKKAHKKRRPRRLLLRSRPPELSLTRCQKTPPRRGFLRPSLSSAHACSRWW